MSMVSVSQPWCAIVSAEKELAITVSVTAPPWQRWWAYVLYVLTLLGAIFGYVRFKTQAQLKRVQELDTLVTERTEQVREKNTQLEQTLDQLKSAQSELQEANEDLLAVLDGSDALRSALLAHYPCARVQRCLVHKERNLRGYLSKRHWAELARLFHLLRKVQGGEQAEAAAAAIRTFLERGLPVFGEIEFFARALVQLAAERNYRPRVIGITGTNGKTSVSHFLAGCLPQCAILGTEGNGFPGRLEPATHTTPDGLALHAWLARFRDARARHVAMEVSSHALHQQRTAGVRFDTAVFTNLGHDHLDYHRDLDDYAAAKAGLFASPGLRAAVLNADDPYSDRMAAALAPGGAISPFGNGLANVATYVTPLSSEA